MRTGEEKITLAHGAGGEVMHKLIKQKILKYFCNGSKIDVPLSALDDSAVIKGIVFTTDSHTVKPLFFPGGDIGALAVAGTVNDIAVMGAKPIALSCGFVIEEGFPVQEFDRILRSMMRTSRTANVPIVTGDTKVVERGALEKIIINTSGIGLRTALLDKNIQKAERYRNIRYKWLLDSNLKDGDAIIISGNIAEHGIALLSFREGYGFESKVKSDIRPLNKMIESILKIGGIVAMKDPTRGGVANTMNEFAEKSRVGIEIEEDALPISEGVRSACELLGIDPLEIGNEGVAVVGAVKEKADAILSELRKTKEGRNAEIIGRCKKGLRGVVMKTSIGGKRIIDKPVGDPIPRIC